MKLEFVYLLFKSLNFVLKNDIQILYKIYFVIDGFVKYLIFIIYGLHKTKLKKKVICLFLKSMNFSKYKYG